MVKKTKNSVVETQMTAVDENKREDAESSNVCYFEVDVVFVCFRTEIMLISNH